MTLLRFLSSTLLLLLLPHLWAMGAKQSAFYYVQQVQTAHLKPVAKPAQCYRLILTGLGSLTYFSDKPGRDSQQMPVTEFLRMWHYNHKHYDSRHNVAIAGFYEDQHRLKRIDWVASLSNPRYDSTSGTLSYLACPLHNKNHTAALPPKLNALTLFFDPFHPWPP